MCRIMELYASGDQSYDADFPETSATRGDLKRAALDENGGGFLPP